MTKFLVVLSILFAFWGYQEIKKSDLIPEFTEEQIEFICNEEGLI